MIESPQELPLARDILEEIVSRVPLIDLVSVHGVSSTWQHAVISSLRHLNTVKPWLIIHTQTTRSPYVITTLAYDARSDVWIEIRRPSVDYFSALKSSHSSLLYMLSLSRFAFSNDPLHVKWQESGAPIRWRPDPIVAAIGNRIIVAGSPAASWIHDDLPALEIYDTMTRSTECCDSMPSELMESAASTWLSVAVDEHKMYLSLKNSGVTYSFDPNSKNWCGPYNLRPDPDVFFSVIEFLGDRLILIGLIGDSENVKDVMIWEVKLENSDNQNLCKQITKMPLELLKKLKGESSNLPSISLTAVGDFVFIHNPLDPREVIVSEFVENKGDWQWKSIRIFGCDDGRRMRRLLFTSSIVTLADLGESLSLGNQIFTVN